MKMLMPGLMDSVPVGWAGGEELDYRKVWEAKWADLEKGPRDVVKDLEKKCSEVEEKFGKITMPDLMDISLTKVAVDVFADHWFEHKIYSHFFKKKILTQTNKYTQITRFFWCYSLQKMIPMGELLTYPLSSAVSGSPSSPPASNNKLSPLTFFNTFLNDVTNWVAVLILSLRAPEERATMITYFIELLERFIFFLFSLFSPSLTSFH